MYRRGDILARINSEIFAPAVFLTERLLTLSCQRARRDNPDLFTQLVDLRLMRYRLAPLLL